MLNRPPNRRKKRDWYFKTGVVSLFCATGMLATLVMLGETGDFVLVEWFQCLIPIPAFIGSQLSGSTYFGKEADLIEDEKTTWSPEQFGTLFGIIAGLTVGIVLLVARTSINLVTAGGLEITVAAIGGTSSIIASVASFAGFGHRLGLVLTAPEEGPFFQRLITTLTREKKAIIMGTLMGLGTSLSLWFLGSASLTMVAGVTTFLTGGAAIPFWLVGGLFVLSYTGTNAASFEYTSKAYTFFLHVFKNDDTSKAIMAGKTHEYRGSAIGITLGYAIAGAIFITLLVTQPYMVALVGGLAVTLACTNVLGGFFARIGRLIDKFYIPLELPPPSDEADDVSDVKEFSSSPATVVKLLENSPPTQYPPVYPQLRGNKPSQPSSVYPKMTSLVSPTPLDAEDTLNQWNPPGLR